MQSGTDEGLAMCRWAYYQIEDEDMDGCQLSLGFEIDPQTQLENIQAEIHKIISYGFSDWRVIQNDKWNYRTNAVMSISTFCELLEVVSKVYNTYKQDKDLTEEFVYNYCSNRLMRNLVHEAALLILSKDKRVTLEVKKRHRDRDFWMDEKWPFDLKTTRPFRDLWKEPSLEIRKVKLDNWINNPHSYSARLYRDQSKEGRCNFQNRLTVINYNLYTNDWLAQQLDFVRLEELLTEWCEGFDIRKVQALRMRDIFKRKYVLYDPNLIIYSGLIWNVVR